MGQHTTSAAGGFQGSIGSLPLVDLLQVWSLNQFSGLVTVSSRGRTGRLYFDLGEIVHAEAEDATGEVAVRVLLGWPDGSFEPIPNTTTLKRTISKRLSHLLLDAHRELDEQRRDALASSSVALTPPPGTLRAGPGGKEGTSSSALDRIRALPGVTGLVRFGSDGRPTGASSHDGEALAAKGLYLALTNAAAIAEAFGLHELTVAALQGARESFVLVHSRGSFLAVGVAQGVAVDPLAAQVRALLTRPASR